MENKRISTNAYRALTMDFKENDVGTNPAIATCRNDETISNLEVECSLYVHVFFKLCPKPNVELVYQTSKPPNHLGAENSLFHVESFTLCSTITHKIHRNKNKKTPAILVTTNSKFLLKT